MIRLLFPLADVLHLAEHAVAAPEHQRSFSKDPGTSPKPALWCVGDEGIYLMSNGLPAQPHPTDSDRLLIVYADGYDTPAAKHAIHAQIGGDDFCEVLPLLDPSPDGTILHTELVAALAGGATNFVIDIDPQHLDIYTG